MGLHPYAVSYLAAIAGEPSVTGMTPEQARAIRVARIAATPRQPEPVARITDLVVPGPVGAIPVRLYVPNGHPPFPTVVYLHGGGWVVGDLDQVDSVCRLLCNASAAMVASVDYHLAPENPFPIPAEEAYRVLQWAATEAGPWGGDGARIAVAGDSAGGNLALAATLMSIDRQTPRVSAQALIYPVCAYQFDTPSYLQWGTGHGLTRDAMQWYSSHYLPRPDDARNPYAAPLARQDLSGLPPTVLITAEYDPLRDEGEAMAERLWSSGVTTTAQRFLGMVHGFFSGEWAPQHRRQAVDAVASHLLHGWA